MLTTETFFESLTKWGREFANSYIEIKRLLEKQPAQEVWNSNNEELPLMFNILPSSYYIMRVKNNIS